MQGSILCPNRDAAEVDDAGHVQVIGFEGDRKSDYVEVSDRSLRFERKQRRAGAFVLLHFIECVRTRVSKASFTRGALPGGRTSDTVRQERSLTRHTGNAIEEFVHRLKAKVRHPDGIDVRIT